MKSQLKKAMALWAEFSSVIPGTYASSIAFFAFLSLIPLLTLGISLVTMAGLGEQEVAAFFTTLVPETFDGFTRTLIGDAYRQSGIAFSISTLTLLWSASQGTRALQGALNAAYGVEEERGVIVSVAVSIGAAIILGILFAATMYFMFGGAVSRAIAPFVPGLEHRGDVMNVLNWSIMAIVGTVALASCYAYLPSGRRRFTDQLPGAVLASLSCGVLTAGFHIYVDNFCNYEALYGSIATIALFLLWLYLMAYILIVGAFLNRARTFSQNTTD